MFPPDEVTFPPILKTDLGFHLGGKHRHLRLRRADGNTMALWTDEKDTRPGKFKADAFFKDIKIRTINLSEVHP